MNRLLTQISEAEASRPESRLLLLTAKIDLNEDQLREARDLATKIVDWPFVTLTAANKFSVPFVYRALLQCAADIVPPSIMLELKNMTMISGMSTLAVVAAKAKFHETCIAPIEARHAYLKGIALSHIIHKSVADRYCRDVDVLVASDDFNEVCTLAHKAGYRIVIGYEPLRYAETKEEIEFVLRYEDILELISPEGVSIDVHKRLTKMSLSFDEKKLFDDPKKIEVFGTKLNTLSNSLHFVYICYHHSRHFWSRLHWLADVNAMIASPSFNRPEVERLADELGIKPTIDATFEFNELVSQPGLWPDDLSSIPNVSGYAFLRACLYNLGGGPEREMELRQHKKLGDFMSTWQINKSRRAKMLLEWYQRNLRPRSAQYLVHPRSTAFHWVYVVQNVWMLIRDTFNWVRSKVFSPPLKRRKL